jgi:hypothetical protein
MSKLTHGQRKALMEEAVSELDNETLRAVHLRLRRFIYDHDPTRIVPDWWRTPLRAVEAEMAVRVIPIPRGCPECGKSMVHAAWCSLGRHGLVATMDGIERRRET